MVPETMIDASDITKQYPNGTQALAGVSLRIAEGEMVSLLGPSGCGKSTLLRVLSGLESPSGGTIARTERAKASAFVFQEPALLPWRTVADNVQLALELGSHGAGSKGPSTREPQNAVVEALNVVGLSDFARVYPRELSGGMKMRVSLARALVRKPNVLFLDEPFAALDELSRQRLNGDLLRIQRELSATVVMVTHNVFEAAFLSTRIMQMSARPGTIAAEFDCGPNTQRDAGYRASAEFAEIVAKVTRAMGA
jgi:NitT/TauT family transport system ATP-binding protein